MRGLSIFVSLNFISILLYGQNTYEQHNNYEEAIALIKQLNEMVNIFKTPLIFLLNKEEFNLNFYSFMFTSNQIIENQFQTLFKTIFSKLDKDLLEYVDSLTELASAIKFQIIPDVKEKTSNFNKDLKFILKLKKELIEIRSKPNLTNLSVNEKDVLFTKLKTFEDIHKRILNIEFSENEGYLQEFLMELMVEIKNLIISLNLDQLRNNPNDNVNNASTTTSSKNSNSVNSY